MNQIVSRGHSRPVTEIHYISDSDSKTLLVSSAHDKIPQIRNGETGDWIGSFHGHKGAVWSIKIDQATRTLAATASGDFSAKLWCATTGKELHELKHKHVVKSVDFTQDSLRIATGCQDGLIRIFDTCQPQNSPQEVKVASSFNDAITKLFWKDEGAATLLVGKRSGVIEAWDSRISSTSGPAQSVALSSGQVVMDMELHPNKNMLIAASGKKVTLLSLDRLEVVREFEMPNPMNFVEEGGVSLSPDGMRFLAGASDLWLREFDASTGDVLQTFKGHHGPIRCVKYHPVKNQCATGSEDATIRIWDLNPSS